MDTHQNNQTNNAWNSQVNRKQWQKCQNTADQSLQRQ
jgi:hypothetical protein